jgi:phosphohistidine phosphatase
MKKLFLVRHAKSSWDDHNLSDFERPLNKRGRRDAPFMAKLISQQGLSPDLIISSPANRAVTTARFFSETFNYKFDELFLEPRLYEASGEDLLDVIYEIGNSFTNVMMFAHNPGLTDLANILTGKRIDNIPTCGIVSIGFNVDLWEEINSQNSELIFFEYPKKYFK